MVSKDCHHDFICKNCGLSFDDRMRVEEVRARILSGFPGINDLPPYEAPLGLIRLRYLLSN